MTSASNHHAATASDEDRTWILVVAATGWAVLTTIVVLLAVGTWSIDPTSADQPSRVTSPEASQNAEIGGTPTQRAPVTAANR